MRSKGRHNSSKMLCPLTKTLNGCVAYADVDAGLSHTMELSTVHMANIKVDLKKSLFLLRALLPTAYVGTSHYHPHLSLVGITKCLQSN